MKRRNLLLLAAAGVAGLLVIELLLRLAGYSAPRWYRPDPVLGWALRPQVSGMYSNEGASHVRINSAGQRDRERTVEKPDGVYRIAVLGDAYSEAMQVALDDSYWAQLPVLLQSCGFQPGRQIEVLNFGVRDYGTAQAYLVLERTVLRYRPDLVLLQFSNANDVRDNLRALADRKGRPYFRFDDAGALRLDDSFKRRASHRKVTEPLRGALRALSDHSRTLQLAGEARRAALLKSAHAGGRRAGVPGLEVEALAAPSDARWVEAWRITEALVQRIGAVASQHGAKAALVAVPFAMEVHPDRAWRERVQAKYGVADLAYPDRRVVAFARRIGMHGILLAPDMKAAADATATALYGYENRRPGFGHWNELGHRVAAEAIARSLCSAPGLAGASTLGEGVVE